MFEVEMKFRLSDVEVFKGELMKNFQTVFNAGQMEEDLYFQRLSRDFRETGEALRIRRVGSDLRITYKGPRLDQVTKMREEIELPLFREEDSPLEERKEDWIRLLTRLGYEPFATVRKTRRSAEGRFQDRFFHFTIDHLDELGDFAEIETMVSSKEDLADARTCLIALAAQLGLKESVRSSYLTLLLAKRDADGNHVEIGK